MGLQLRRQERRLRAAHRAGIKTTPPSLSALAIPRGCASLLSHRRLYFQPSCELWRSGRHGLIDRCSALSRELTRTINVVGLVAIGRRTLHGKTKKCPAIDVLHDDKDD